MAEAIAAWRRSERGRLFGVRNNSRYRLRHATTDGRRRDLAERIESCDAEIMKLDAPEYDDTNISDEDESVISGRLRRLREAREAKNAKGLPPDLEPAEFDRALSGK